MKEINLKVEGMMCTGCENRIQNAVKNMNGIKSVKADHTTGTVKIEAEKRIAECSIKLHETKENKELNKKYQELLQRHMSFRYKNT